MSNTTTQYPTQPYGPVGPNTPFPQGPAPKKKHTIRNLVIASIAVVAVIGGCSTALAGGGSGTAEADLPGASTSQAAKPAEKNAAETDAADSQPAEQKPPMTKSQEEAVEAAESYLSSGSFSKKGLFHQLTSEYGSDFSKADATFALKHVDADWNAEAVEAAESYLESGSFSRQSLLNQLTSEYGSQFTKAQARHAVDEVGL